MQENRPYYQPPQYVPPNYEQYKAPPMPDPIPQPQQPPNNNGDWLPKRIAALEVCKRQTTFKYALIAACFGLLVAPALYIFNMGAGIGASVLFLAAFMFLLVKVTGHIQYLTNTYQLDPRDIKPMI